MKHEERDLEKRCNDYARSHDWTAWKNEKNGNKGIPDYSYLHTSGAFLLIEFKNPEGRVRPEQRKWFRRFPSVVHIVRDFECFCDILTKAAPP